MNAHVQEWWRPDTAPLVRSARSEDAHERGAGRLGFQALVAFMFILVVAPQEWVSALRPFRLAFVAAVLAIGCYLYDRWQGRTTPARSQREVVLVLLLVGWAIVTMPWSLWPGGSVSRLTDLYLKSVAVFVLLAGVVDTTRRFRVISWTLALCTLPVSATALLHYASGTFMGTSQRIAGYPGGLASNPNDLALLLNLVAPLMVALAGDARRRTARWLALGLLALAGAAIVVTFSRSGFLTLAAIGILYVWRLMRRGHLGLAALIVVLALGASVFAPSGYSDRLGTVVDIQTDQTQSAQSRWRDMVLGAQYFLEHPVFGAGLGNDTLALNEMRGAAWLPVHNVYLNYAVDLGLPGLALFVALFVCCVGAAAGVERRHVRGPHEDALGRFAGAVRISLVAFVLSAMFYPVAYHAYFYYFAGLAVALRGLDERRADDAGDMAPLGAH